MSEEFDAAVRRAIREEKADGFWDDGALGDAEPVQEDPAPLDLPRSQHSAITTPERPPVIIDGLTDQPTQLDETIQALHATVGYLNLKIVGNRESIKRLQDSLNSNRSLTYKRLHDKQKQIDSLTVQIRATQLLCLIAIFVATTAIVIAIRG